jgi:hypothetical protein
MVCEREIGSFRGPSASISGAGWAGIAHSEAGDRELFREFIGDILQWRRTAVIDDNYLELAYRQRLPSQRGETGAQTVRIVEGRYNDRDKEFQIELPSAILSDLDL